MIRYIAFFDKVANRYCSDLIPVDDDDAMILRVAKRFTFNKYCSFVKPQEIECRHVANWDSEKNGLAVCKRMWCFTLDQVDTLYAAIAEQRKVKGITGVTMPEVKTNVSHGDFIRETEKKLEEEIKNDEE